MELFDTHAHLTDEQLAAAVASGTLSVDRSRHRNLELDEIAKYRAALQDAGQCALRAGQN